MNVVLCNSDRCGKGARTEVVDGRRLPLLSEWCSGLLEPTGLYVSKLDDERGGSREFVRPLMSTYTAPVLR
jgi:hypothetical protein